MIAERIPNTLVLVGVSFLVTLLIATPGRDPFGTQTVFVLRLHC